MKAIFIVWLPFSLAFLGTGTNEPTSTVRPICFNGGEYADETNECYELITSNFTNDEARSYCKTKGGKLATIKSEIEFDIIYGTFSSESEYWIDLQREGDRFLTTDSFNATDFSCERENGCTALDGNNWRCESCDCKLNFICSLPIDYSISTQILMSFLIATTLFL